MYKIFIASLLFISGIIWSQYLYAHNANPESDNIETKRETAKAEEQ